MKTHVNLLALTMGLDPQDIWPLSSHSLGSGAQSSILEQKTRGKGPGYVLVLLERLWNSVLPRSLEFKYKAANSQQGMEEAQIAFQWSQTLNPILWMTDDEKRQIMANQVDAFQDALLDEDGTVIRLPDVDPKDTAQQEDTIVDDAVQTGVTATEDATTASDTEQLGQNAPTGKEPPPAAKEYDKAHTPPANQPNKPFAKRANAFTSTMATLMQRAIADQIAKAIAKAQMKAALLNAGQQTYEDVLAENGIDELDDSDNEDIAAWLTTQSGYVDGMADQLYSADGISGSVEDRAAKWEAAIAAIYYIAAQNADEDGYYTFTGDDGKESCETCQSLKDETHRMSWWVDNELRPGVDHDNFECGTWNNCQHYLEKSAIDVSALTG